MGKKIDDVEMREKIRDEEVPDYINLYDGCIRYTDWVLQSLIRKIEKNFPETLFVITADHGEEFREHGGLGHEEKLYDELLHIPLIFYGKDVGGSRMEKPVSLLHLVPTIFHFLGLQGNEWMQGKNVFEMTEEYIIAEAWKGERITAYRDSEWKLIISGDKKELYNLRDDPKEQQNLYEREEHKEKCREFEKIINNHVEMLEEERKRRMTWLQKEKIRKAMRRMRD